MAESLKVLRRRVRSVKNIGKITRAMEMVSASKLRRTQGILMAGRPYAGKLQELIAHVAGGSASEHPLFQPREGSRKLLVLFTADRGLCGSFNTNLINQAERLMKSEPETQWELVCVGKRGIDYFGRRRWPIVNKVVGLGGQPDSDEARRIADYVLKRYENNEVDKVLLLYSSFISTVRYLPTLAQYLPMTPEALGLDEAVEKKSGAQRNYIMEPSPEALFDSLLPRYLSSKIYISMAETNTSEHSARMIAMNNATKNCKELSTDLTLRMNRARQDTITKELLDIVGGAEALNV